MFGLGIPEIIIILLAVGVLLFGSKKIIEVARSMGRFTGEFKKGKRDIEAEIKKTQENVMQEPSAEDQTNASTENKEENKN